MALGLKSPDSRVAEYLAMVRLRTEGLILLNAVLGEQIKGRVPVLTLVDLIDNKRAA